MRLRKVTLTIILVMLLAGCKADTITDYQYQTRDYYSYDNDAYFGVHLNLEKDNHSDRERYIVEDDRELALLIYYNYLQGNRSTEFVIRGNELNVDHTYLNLYAILPETFAFSYYDHDGYGEISLTLFKEFDNEELDLVATEIIKEIPEDLTDREKVKYIHDYLIKNAEYDMHAFNHLDDWELYYQASHAYSVIVEEVGMCAGYSMAVNYLLDKLSIPSIMINSVAEGHAWNLVFIEDQWYQLDVTWDDPIPDVKGRVMYTHYLKPVSNNRFAGHRYDNYSDTTYDLKTYVEYGNWLLGIEENGESDQ